MRDRTARRIVGLSLPPALACEVKQEAARSGLSLEELVLEMWQLCKTEGHGTRKG